MRAASESKASLIGIVDDDSGVRESISSLVRSGGFRAAVSSSAEDFLHSEELKYADCLILDARKPGITGLERGAFTGAIAQRLGRFELANRGSLFLDEIGDIPAELQPKLLRVLQEQEFERPGSTQTIKTDVRLIAATHHNLREIVAEGKFREDLLYRLNVFPVTVPPLRERAEDIPLLARHFVDLFAHRMNRRIEVIPNYIVDGLSRYQWPGNIRELENFLKRSVILTTGASLEAPLHELALLEEETAPAPMRLRDAERAHIRKILKETNGVIATAAQRLGLQRSTLFYKIRRLGIIAAREQNRSRNQAFAAA